MKASQNLKKQYTSYWKRICGEGGQSGMAARVIRVVKRLGIVPVVAACQACGREFKAPMKMYGSVREATANLQMQFDRHSCDEQGTPTSP
jgi:hypothetical protein